MGKFIKELISSFNSDGLTMGNCFFLLLSFSITGKRFCCDWLLLKFTRFFYDILFSLKMPVEEVLRFLAGLIFCMIFGSNGLVSLTLCFSCY